MLGWPPEAAEHADATEIVAALHARHRHDQRNLRTLGRFMGVTFKDEAEAAEAAPSAEELDQRLRAAFFPRTGRKA